MRAGSLVHRSDRVRNHEEGIQEKIHPTRQARYPPALPSTASLDAGPRRLFPLAPPTFGVAAQVGGAGENSRRGPEVRLTANGRAGVCLAWWYVG